MISREKIISFCSTASRFFLGAIIFFVPIYFAWFQENFTVFDLNKSVALRAILTLALLAWLIRVCLTGKFIISGSRRLFLSLATLSLLLVINTACSLHPAISLWGSYERQQGLYNILSYLIFFCLIIAEFRSRRDVEAWIIALLSASGVICAYGLIQALGFDFLRWGESSQHRIFSSFGQPNFLGQFLIVVIPLTIYAAVHIIRTIYGRMACAVLLAAEFACLFFTYSRSAWVAGLVTLAVALVVLVYMSGKKRLAIAGIAVACILVSVIALNPVRSYLLDSTSKYSPALNRVVSILNFGGGSNRIRFYYWQAALTDLKQASWPRKLFGYGPDVQASVYVRYYQPAWGYYERLNSYPDRAHNLILDTILQFGIFGLAAFCWFTGYITIGLVRRLKEKIGPDYWLSFSLLAALTAYGINNLFSFSLTAMAVVFYGLLGVGLLVGRGYRHVEVSLAFFHPLSRWTIAGAIGVLAMILLYGNNIKPLMADYYYFNVKKAENRGNCRDLLDNMEKVMEWYPKNHYYARAYLYHVTNCFSATTTKEARQQLGENMIEQAAAIPLRERQYYTFIDLAHMYSIMGSYLDPSYFTEAEQYYQELIRISPAITVIYQDYGRMKIWQGKYNEAIDLFKQGIAMLPDTEGWPEHEEHIASIIDQNAYFNELIASAYLDLKDEEQAISWYEKSLRIKPRASAALGLSAIYKDKDDRQSALRYAKEAIGLDPFNEEAKRRINELNK